MRILQDAEIKNKKVFLRVDFNVPMHGDQITDNNRIKAVIPTLKYLVGEKAKIIIGAHLGRPEGQKSAETSLMPVAKELQRLLNLKVALAPDILSPETEKMVESLQAGGIVMLENLRWDPEEEQNDAGFARKLANFAEVYINDAFAVSHRANASVEAIAKFLPSYAGFLLQEEVEKLSALNNPRSPFVLIIGGIKVKDKAGVIKELAPKSSHILLGGGVANTFLKAKGEDIGKSVYDEEMVEQCREMLDKYKDKIILPVDYATSSVISTGVEKSDTQCHPELVEGSHPYPKDLSTSARDDNNFKILDLGPNTIETYAREIKKAKTVFWNGSLGYSEDPEFRTGMKAVAQAMALVSGTTVIAGGDTVGFVKEEGLDKNISFISTGGGAALEFLAGEKLPGIEALN